jgi:hypothetical protein
VTIQSVCVIRNSGCCNRVPCSGTTQLRREIMGQEIGASRSSIVGVPWISLYMAIVPIYYTALEHCTLHKYTYIQNKRKEEEEIRTLPATFFGFRFFSFLWNVKRDRRELPENEKSISKKLYSLSNRTFVFFFFLYSWLFFLSLTTSGNSVVERERRATWKSKWNIGVNREICMATEKSRRTAFTYIEDGRKKKGKNVLVPIK